MSAAQNPEFSGFWVFPLTRRRILCLLGAVGMNLIAGAAAEVVADVVAGTDVVGFRAAASRFLHRDGWWESSQPSMLQGRSFLQSFVSWFLFIQWGIFSRLELVLRAYRSAIHCSKDRRWVFSAFPLLHRILVSCRTCFSMPYASLVLSIKLRPLAAYLLDVFFFVSHSYLLALVLMLVIVLDTWLR